MALTKVSYAMINGAPVNVLDFGASPSASAATNNTAFAAAIAAVATTGQTIYIPSGTYNLSQAFSTTGHLSIIGDGDSSVLDFSGMTTGNAISVSGSLTQIQEITSASLDALTVTFASPPSLAVGDVFVIYNPTDYSYSGFRAYYHAGEWCEVRGVSGNNATVTNPLYASYVPANVDVYKMNSKIASFRNFKIKGTTDAGLINISLCKNAIVENVTGYNEGNFCVAFDRCYQSTAINLTLFNKGDGGDDYGLVVTNAQDIEVIGGNYYARRHAITTGGANDVGSVPCRNLRFSSLTTKNDISSGVWSADFHGNTENSYYEDCTIYNGATFQGCNNKYINCYISSGSQHWCVYAGEIVGGYHKLENCELHCANDPQPNTRGIIDIGGNSDPVTANTTQTTQFIIRNCTIEAVNSGAATSFVLFRNNGTSQNINFVIDGITGIGIASFGQILYTQNVSGTAASQFIIVDNISRFPSGTILHNAAGTAYRDFPHRCQMQTGTLSMTATSGTATTINAAVNFRYVYPREPSCSVSTIGSQAVSNGNRPILPVLYNVEATYVRPAIVTGDLANWSATNSITVAWSANINDI
jgi:hypothetical protein